MLSRFFYVHIILFLRASFLPSSNETWFLLWLRSIEDSIIWSIINVTDNHVFAARQSNIKQRFPNRQPKSTAKLLTGINNFSKQVGFTKCRTLKQKHHCKDEQLDISFNSKSLSTTSQLLKNCPNTVYHLKSIDFPEIYSSSNVSLVDGFMSARHLLLRLAALIFQHNSVGMWALQCRPHHWVYMDIIDAGGNL